MANTRRKLTDQEQVRLAAWLAEELYEKFTTSTNPDSDFDDQLFEWANVQAWNVVERYSKGGPDAARRAYDKAVATKTAKDYTIGFLLIHPNRPNVSYPITHTFHAISIDDAMAQAMRYADEYEERTGSILIFNA